LPIQNREVHRDGSVGGNILDASLNDRSSFLNGFLVPALKHSVSPTMVTWETILEFVKNPYILATINFWVFVLFWSLWKPCIFKFTHAEFWRISWIVILLSIVVLLYRTPEWLNVNWDTRRVKLLGTDTTEQVTVELVSAYLFISFSYSLCWKT